MIKREGNKWVLYNRAGTRVLGRHDTPESARRQETAILIRQGKIKVKKAAVRNKYDLYPHQAAAIKQLLDNDGTLVMAHGTGLGKTFSSIAGLEVLRVRGKAGNALVVTPTSLRKNFAENIEKFTDSNYQIVGNQQERKLGYKYPTEVSPDKKYTIVGYAMFRSDPVGLMKRTGADTLILDEFHKARDPQGLTFKSAMRARQHARNFIGLTASMVSNDPNEVAPLIAIAKSGHFITRLQFNRFYKEPYGTQKGFFGGERKIYTLRNVDDLKRRVGPVLSYLDTTDVKKGALPRREVQDIPVEMSPQQRKLYEFALRKLPPRTAEKIRLNLPVNQHEAFNIFTMIQQARQVSNSTHTLDKRVTLEEAARTTPKVKRMLDDAAEHLKNVKDGKVVMYSNLVNGGVDVLHAGLKARGIPHGIFVGKGRQVGGRVIEEAGRAQDVKDFQSGKTRVIILSGAGAEGLDLKNATMFQSLDGHFNPERIRQAEARAIRLRGQAHRPPEERAVEVRRYKSVLPNPGWFARWFGGKKKEFSTDEWVYNVAQRKYILNRMLRNIVRSVSLSKPTGAAPEIKVPRPAAPAGIRAAGGVGRPQPGVVPGRTTGGPVVTPSVRQTKYLRRWKDLKGRWRYEYAKEAS